MKPSSLILALLLAIPLSSTGTLANAQAAKKAATAAKTVTEQTAWGMPGKATKATRTLKIDMTDAMRFTPDTVTVEQGETVRFVVTNSGRMLHEMVIGTPEKLAEQAAMMAKTPDVQRAAPYIARVAPGATGEIVWNFNRPGAFEFACLIAGHYEAGMRGTLHVTPKQGAAKMNSKLKLALVPVATGLTTAPPVQAEPVTAPAQVAQAAAPTGALSEGVVRKIDTATGKITLKHGPLTNLAMPAMTMVFKVKSPGMLNSVKVGDAVKFRAENINGALTVTEIGRATP